jgi:hypothetical protein
MLDGLGGVLASLPRQNDAVVFVSEDFENFDLQRAQVKLDHSPEEGEDLVSAGSRLRQGAGRKRATPRPVNESSRVVMSPLVSAA